MRRLLPIILLVVLLGLVVRLVTLTPVVRQRPSRPGELTVHFIDVGQGDCVLVCTPDRHSVLVDAGDEENSDRVVSYLTKHGVRRVDLLVITHPHADHIGGLPAVLAEFGVSRVIDSGYPHGSPVYERVLSEIERRRIEYEVAQDERSPSVCRDVEFEVLWPPTSTLEADTDLNNASVVVRVKFKGFALLLMGDVESKAEGRLLAEHRNLRSTVLKVAHHGSSDSTSNEFLQVVKPEYAIVSVGLGNPYGHPSRSTLRRLAAVGAQVFRTDANGTVVVSTDGRRVHVESER